MFEWFRRLIRTFGLGIGPERRRMIARYQYLRRLGMKLNHALMETLEKSVLDEGGKKLGILRRGVLILDSEDHLAVLMDYCIHDIRRNGLTAVERYLRDSPPPEDSEEMVLLRALQQCRYCLFAVERCDPGVGVHGRDLLRDEPIFLVDVGFSLTARPGVVLATRITAPEGIAHTTGAALPAGILSPEEQAAVRQGILTKLRRADFQNISPMEGSELATSIIRDCLRNNSGIQIAYMEPGGTLEGSAAAAFLPEPMQNLPAAMPGRPSTPARPGRPRAKGPSPRAKGPSPRAKGPSPRAKGPCPCGSGKKYRHCCGKRQ